MVTLLYISCILFDVLMSLLIVILLVNLTSLMNGNTSTINKFFKSLSLSKVRIKTNKINESSSEIPVEIPPSTSPIVPRYDVSAFKDRINELKKYDGVLYDIEDVEKDDGKAGVEIISISREADIERNKKVEY